MTYERQAKGSGCFGTIDLRFYSCQTCGDYTSCKKAKERLKYNQKQ